MNHYTRAHTHTHTHTRTRTRTRMRAHTHHRSHYLYYNLFVSVARSELHERPVGREIVRECKCVLRRQHGRHVMSKFRHVEKLACQHVNMATYLHIKACRHVDFQHFNISRTHFKDGTVLHVYVDESTFILIIERVSTYQRSRRDGLGPPLLGSSTDPE